MKEINEALIVAKDLIESIEEHITKRSFSDEYVNRLLYWIHSVATKEQIENVLWAMAMVDDDSALLTELEAFREMHEEHEENFS